MKVALFIERFSPARGGRERSTAEIAEGLVKRGCEVDVVCMSGQADLAGVNVLQLGSAGLGRTHRFRRFVRAARRRMAEGAYSVTHAMFPLPGVDVYQNRGGTLPGLRAAHMRMVGGLSRQSRRLTWRMNRLRALQGRLEARIMADERTTVLPISEMVAEEIRRYYDRTDNVRVVFNGATVPVVDPRTRAEWRRQVRGEWGLADNDVVLLCPAMNFDLKGVGLLLGAFGRICWRPEGDAVRLVVLGSDGPPAEAREHLIGGGTGPVGRPIEPSAPAGVQFRGPTDHIWSAYAAADAVVLLSWYDACSRVVLEAVGFDVPCLTTRFNGAATLLAHGAGWVVPGPQATDQVVEALLRITDPAARAAAAAACRLAAPRAAMSRHVDELMDVYREVMRR